MAEYLIDKAYLVALADAVRKKSESSSKMTPSAMVSAINNLGDMTYTPQSSPTVINKTGELYTIQDTTFNSLANAIRNKAGISDKMTPQKMIDVINGLNSVQAFAVFSADDNSLNFYKRVDVPKVGERFEGKTVTEVYTGFEDGVYTDYAPWYVSAAEGVTNIMFVDRIKPQNTAYWFNELLNLSTIDLNNLDTSAVKSMEGMFCDCYSLTQIDVSMFDTSSVTNMMMMFNGSAIKSLDLSNFDTSSVMSMGAMFMDCYELAVLDISGFTTSGSVDTGYMFTGCDKLQQVMIGDKFSWNGAYTYLPTPSSSHIPNANGKWYALSDGRGGKGYAPDKIPNNTADTYYASKDLLPHTFAVFSADDGSLNFYNRDYVPSVGENFDYCTVTDVYIDIETQNYSEKTLPWRNHAKQIYGVRIMDEIYPVSTAFWFSGFVNCYEFYLSYINGKNVTNSAGMFFGCSNINEIDLSKFETPKLKTCFQMFSGCNKLEKLNISKLNTCNVTINGIPPILITQSYLPCKHMFDFCSSLGEVVLGKNFSIIGDGTCGIVNGTDCRMLLYNYYSSGGKWFNSRGQSFSPDEIPAGIADTYYASKTLIP